MPFENHLKELDQMPYVLSVTDLCSVLGIGRNAAYALIRSGQIQTIQVGARKKVTKSALVAFLNTGD